MLQRLAARLIKNSGRTDLPEVRLAWGRLTSALSIGANVTLFLLKLLAGLAAGSVAVIADGLNNLSDAASNIISLLGFRLAARPADAEHPYGHGRYEYLAGLTVAVLVLAVGLELLKSGVERVLHPAPPVFSWLTAAALVLSVAVKLWMMVLNRRVGRQIGSKTLTATAADSRNDAVATGAVLAGMAITRLTGLDLDGWLCIGVSLFVLYSGLGLVRGTLDPLLGRRPEPEVIEGIRERIMACPGVLGTHDLMLHDYGPGRRFASVHVEMAAEGGVIAQRDALDALAREFWEKDGLHMVFQLDHITGDDTAENRLRRHLASQARLIDPRVTVHDLRLRQDGGVSVRFDCYVPPDVDIPEASIRQMLERIVHELYPGAACAVTLDRDYMAPPHE